MKGKRTYPTWDLWTLTPDKQEDLHFTVQASVTCSDESDVGLSSHEVTVDIDTSTELTEKAKMLEQATELLKQWFQLALKNGVRCYGFVKDTEQFLKV